MQFCNKISREPDSGLLLKTFPVLAWMILFVSCPAVAQFSEDFSDSDLKDNPVWSGSSSDFVVNADGELQLKSTVAGRSWLSTPLVVNPSTSWEWTFLIRQAFSPSSSNYGRFYLTSDSENLTGSLNGYYLQFGEAGAEDAIELFRQTGSATYSVCRGKAGAIANSFTARVMVRYDNGAWEIWADYSGGHNFTLDAQGTNPPDAAGSFCGLVCTYTVSNVSKFYFDDIEVRDLSQPDISPPNIIQVIATGSRVVEVQFDEDIDPSSLTPDSFTTGCAGPAIGVTLAAQAKTVTVTFEHTFPAGQTCTILVSSVRDLAGNVMTPSEFLFSYSAPVFRDVVITEILPDPLPSYGLPESEFIELYNRTGAVVNLGGWKLSDLTSTATIPGFELNPGTYVVLAPAQFATCCGDVIAVPGFPSLNNNGDAIVLSDNRGNIIDSVYYDNKWFHDVSKAAGGWSLELIDPDNICSGRDNWTASENPAGGTPGRQNSVYAQRPDRTGPVVISAIPDDSLRLIVTFNERLDSSLPLVADFQTTGGPVVSGCRFFDRSQTSVEVRFATAMKSGIIYTLQMTRVYDCSGNAIKVPFLEIPFALPQSPASGDLVVNEILFNPRPTGVDFAELYNASEKVFDLANLTLKNPKSSAPHRHAVSGQPRLIFPGQYVALTTNADVLKGEYVSGHEEHFVESEIPPLNDDEGILCLQDVHGLMIDSVFYSRDFHSPFVKNAEGVSLERISPVLPADDPSNWRSGSSASGFATPGYRNANSRPSVTIDEGSVEVEPDILRPTVTSHDFTRINYRFGQGGMIATVRIFDTKGRLIKTVADHELLGTEGFFRWDGETDRGLSASTGYYLVMFQIFDADGVVRIWRKRLAIY